MVASPCSARSTSSSDQIDWIVPSGRMLSVITGLLSAVVPPQPHEKIPVSSRHHSPRQVPPRLLSWHPGIRSRKTRQPQPLSCRQCLLSQRSVSLLTYTQWSFTVPSVPTLSVTRNPFFIA